MSPAYLPGNIAREYENLPPHERQKVSDEVDRIFKRRTGILRKLDTNGDLAARRRWLRIRDEVMISRQKKKTGPVGPARGSLLWNSVGEGGENLKRDVLLVQAILNSIPDSDLYSDDETISRQADGTPVLTVRTLAENGVVSDGLIDCIMRFQRRVVGLEPDGLINPGGPTIKALARRFQSTGLVMQLSDPTGRIDPESVYRIQGGPMHMDGLVFKRGQIIPALDGDRLLLSINSREAVFILMNKNGFDGPLDEMVPMRGEVGRIYVQSRQAFIGEYETRLFKTIARDLKPIKTMIEVEVAILMGIGTTLTGTYWFYVGFTVSDFVARNASKFKHWYALLEAILDARSDLKRVAPVLYDKIFTAVKIQYLDSIRAKDVATLVGRLVGVLGKQAMEGRFSALGMLFTLVAGTAILAVKNVGASIEKAKHDWDSGMNSIDANLRLLGTEITAEDKNKMFAEIMANPREIKSIFEKLKSAFDEHLPFA